MLFRYYETGGQENDAAELFAVLVDASRHRRPENCLSGPAAHRANWKLAWSPITARLSIALWQREAAPRRARELGIIPGVLAPGKLNAITDIAGVRLGHTTITEGTDIRTGVTAIIPHSGNLFQQKVPAAVFVANAFGKLAGSTQVEELGNMETPIILTNTLSVAEGIAGVVEYTLEQPGNERVASVNAVVGETNDRALNDIRRRYVTKQHVKDAILAAKDGPVEEGAVGAGTGTVCFGFKGGIGTASRVLPQALGGFTVGVLVQTNFGGILQINGAPVGRELGQYYLKEHAEALRQEDRAWWWLPPMLHSMRAT